MLSVFGGRGLTARSTLTHGCKILFSLPLAAVPGDEQASQSLLKSSVLAAWNVVENSAAREFLDPNKPATTLVEFCKSA